MINLFSALFLIFSLWGKIGAVVNLNSSSSETWQNNDARRSIHSTDGTASESSDKRRQLIANASEILSYKSLPSLSIIIRTFHKHVPVYLKYFRNGWDLFWPLEYFQSEHVLVMDSESDSDIKAASVLNTVVKNHYHHAKDFMSGYVPRLPRIMFEEHPGPNLLKILSRGSTDGYCRQMWSTFFLDKQSTAEFVARADSDSAFITPITPALLFDNLNRPVMYGYNDPFSQGMCPEVIWIGLGGRPCVADFMVLGGFPVIWKRKHMQEARDDITKKYGKSNFTEAFSYMLQHSKDIISPESMISSWLFYNKRDEYAWHIRDARESNHREIRGEKVTDAHAQLSAEFNIPMVSRMKQIFGPDKVKGHFRFNWQTMTCVASEFSAPGCRTLVRKPVQNILTRWMNYQLGTEYYCAPFPSKCHHSELVWTTKREPNFTDSAVRTYREHVTILVNDAKQRGTLAFGFQRGALFFGLEGLNKNLRDVDAYNEMYVLPDGLLVRGLQKTVSIVLNDTFHRFSSDNDMKLCGFDGSEAVDIAREVSEGHPQGSIVDPHNVRYHKNSFHGNFADGLIIKSVYTKEMFLVANGSRYSFPTWDAFIEAGYNGSEIKLVPKPQLDALPVAGDIRAKNPMFQKTAFAIYNK